jgi:hypothetical protein
MGQLLGDLNMNTRFIHNVVPHAAIALLASSAAFAGGSSVQLTTPRCATVGQEMIVDVRIGAGAPNVVGIQSAISYNGSVLQFLGELPGDAPFDLPIYFQHNAAGQKIDMAVGISPEGSPSSGNVVTKRLRFRVIGGGTDCTPDQLVTFRKDPMIRNLLTDSKGSAITPTLAALNEINLGNAPSVTAPPDVSGTPAPGTMTLTTSVGVVTASGCGPTLNLSFVRSDGETNINAPFQRIDSPVTITWTVTDECGRSASDTQLVTVNVGLGDLSGDGVVDGIDLAVTLNRWGQSGAAGDVDGDGVVTASDLAFILNNWGPVTP